MKEDQQRTDAVTAAHARTGVEVLLVEDNPDDAEFAVEALQECGIDNVPHVVRDGMEALRFLRKEGAYRSSPTPDLILLDLDMPRLSGRKVLEEVKKDDALRGIPVVVFSASEAEEDIGRCYRLQAAAYVVKPAYFSEYVEVVRAVASFWLGIVRYPSR
jgi:CheY-like chemotaxis protein